MTETKIDPRTSALLVMDYQHGIVAQLPDAEELVERAASVIAFARERGMQIGYVRVAFTGADAEAMPDTSPMAAMVKSRLDELHADAPTTAIHDAVAPRDGDIIVRKTRVGPFLTTDLDQQLRGNGIDTVILAGISTSGVVLSTVRDAADRDYRVIVLADGCADPDAEVHTFLTERIFPRQAQVMTIAELAEAR
ncbi:MAG TPA: cysteine hydrolase [Solirubrobacteraceae bacterium]|jgi:nicotinamidase-related amidase|nr:cysteine hydrolase [Solirubrobacteraceae bacterium]